MANEFFHLAWSCSCESHPFVQCHQKSACEYVLLGSSKTWTPESVVDVPKKYTSGSKCPITENLEQGIKYYLYQATIFLKLFLTSSKCYFYGNSQ